MPVREGIYGLLAEFDTPSELVVAAKTAYDSGWRRMDCYTPYPVEEAAEVIGFHRNYVPLICLVGGLMGLAAMFLMETWVSVLAYPLNIAGRPLFSWPAFIIPAYEWTILWAGLSAAFGMLAMCGLPTLYHPLFNAPNFRNGRNHRQILSLPGSQRSQVRRGGIARLSRKLRAGLGGGGGVLIRSTPMRPASRLLFMGLAALSSWRRLPPGHAKSAQICSPAQHHIFRGWPLGSTPGGAHRCPRPVGRRRFLLHRLDRWQGSGHAAFPGQHAGDGARPGAVQHLLHALPFARGQRRRHDRAARLQACGQFPLCAHPCRAPGPLLLRHDQRLRSHAGLFFPADPGGPLGGGRLYSGAANQPERQRIRGSLRGPGTEPERHRGAAGAA